jgi:hypothetical protein
LYESQYFYRKDGPFSVKAIAIYTGVYFWTGASVEIFGRSDNRRAGSKARRPWGNYIVSVVAAVAFTCLACIAAKAQFHLPHLPVPSPLPGANPTVGVSIELLPLAKTGEIPKNFKTYSFFLVCNPQWLAPGKRSGLLDLYLQFHEFGRTIGNDNAAIWFLKSVSTHDDTGLSNNTDVERSVRLCRAWDLTPSEGPHLVITTYPDESLLSSRIPPHLPEKSAVYKLGTMSPEDISKLLAKITDGLVKRGQIEDLLSNPPSVAPPLWARLLEVTQQTIKSFGCAWSFKIDAGPVKADLHSCPSE